jgi:uncharacterized RDD family membrane protein YckC
MHNAEPEGRCRRCGKKSSDTPAEYLHTTHGALATAPQRAAVEAPPYIPGTEESRQGRLFADGRIMPPNGRPKIVSINRTAVPQQPPAQTKPRTSGPKPPQRPRPPRTEDTQQRLDFLAPTAAPRKLDTTVEARIYCDFPVAALPHRALGAALDWAVITVAYGLFLATLYFAGGEFLLTKANVMVLGAAYALIAVFYGFLWALGGKETAGMQWAGLRLVNFDGFPPEPGQRFLRFAATCLSSATVVGLLWAVGDEEKLTWQDHISRTFPTPRISVSSPVSRRR